MIEYTAILTANYSNAQWIFNGDNYDGLTWLDSTPKPTQAELDAQWLSVQTKLAKAITDKATAKQAVLTKLGLTADEVTALLG